MNKTSKVLSIVSSKQKRVYSFARAAITKYQRLDGLNNKNLFSHSFGCYKSKIRC